MSDYSELLSPLRLRHLTIRNRVMSTGHAPGITSDGGMPGERYQLYHEEKAKGGIGLTIFGGSSSVAPDSPLPFGQIDLATDRILPYLQTFSERVHRHGTALMCQITHLGRRSSWAGHHWLPLIAPSGTREVLHRSYAKEMEDWDFTRVIRAFADAAERCKRGGLDGVEVMAAAHHLIDSFLSPVTNQRSDAYGGSLENRCRFGLEVLRAIRERVGDNFVVGLRFSGDELLEGGNDAEACLRIASIFGNSGLLDFLNVYQAHADNFAGLSALFPDMSSPPAPFLYLASAVKAETDVAVFHASGVRDVATASRAIADGHVDLVAMTRAHIADPHIVNKLREGRADDIRQCVGANYCVDFSDAGGGVLCVHNASTGREKSLPHIVSKAREARRVVIAGGGPGGLEAARVAADRGHKVTLFEASDRLGGQINIAQTVAIRESMSGITRWLDHQIRRKGVDIRLQTEATAANVAAEAPDIVVVATGGEPRRPGFKGAELTVSSWDILTGKVGPGTNALIYDEVGLQGGVGAADFLSTRGAAVELVSPDRLVGQETGSTIHVPFMRRLYGRNVIFTPNMMLVGAYQERNELVAVLRNEFTGVEEERAVDQIVTDYGTLPNEDLYHALRPGSVNLGEVDYDALIEGQPQALRSNDTGTYQLFRIGDAVFMRNIHAAIYDAARLLKDL